MKKYWKLPPLNRLPEGLSGNKLCEIELNFGLYSRRLKRNIL